MPVFRAASSSCCLELDIAEGLALLVARRRQAVEVAFAEASLTVFMHASAEVPPITKARW